VIHALLRGLAIRDNPSPVSSSTPAATSPCRARSQPSTSGNEYHCCASSGIGFGERNPRVWSDIADLPEIRTLPNNHIRRPMGLVDHWDGPEVCGEYSHRECVSECEV